MEYTLSGDTSDSPGYMVQDRASKEEGRDPLCFGLYVDLDFMRVHVASVEALETFGDAMLTFTIADMVDEVIDYKEESVGGPLDNEDGGVEAVIAALRAEADRLETRLRRE